MIRIKICGITCLEDAKTASNFGVDAIGFIFYRKSKRFISPENAAAIIRQIPPFITTIGVFVDESLENIKDIIRITGISAVQLHGNETEEFCSMVPGRVIKAFRLVPGFRLSTIKSYRSITAFLLDTWDDKLYGGTGKPLNWSVAAEANKFGNLILAGGLGPNNLKEAIDVVTPYAVDVNSGVEVMPGKKNFVKIKEVVDIVKKYPGGNAVKL